MARNAAQSLLILIGLWLVMAMLVPRAGAGLAAMVHPAPPADSFFAGMAADLKAQPDPFGKDSDAFAAEVARRYGVARPEDAPVSIDGLRLDESERHGNIVFDRHYGRLAETYAAERRLLRLGGLVSPLLPLQNLSMALAGTDTAHQLAFQDAAEAHRRELIHALNMDMALHGKGKDFDYLADGDLWKRSRDFRYAPPPIAAAMDAALPDLLLLLGWAAAAAVLMRMAGRRLMRSSL